ncbi:MAG: hypothetical protein JXR32_03395 [Anaerolineaceae bacterium]|nr:hypothetical protein [Anaerolineaceae bacterium]
MENVSGSFRDPNGFLFTRGKTLYRQVNKAYQKHYKLLMTSGLYSRLVDDGLLVKHEETSQSPLNQTLAYKVIKPETIGFISYPYEWCFSQYKDAALCTLSIMKHALEFNMVLKDASAYNIQFLNGMPLLIDTLSFEKYQEGYPWVAYRQFCQHFLAPLALMANTDIRMSQLMRVYIDGVPLDLASSLLPAKTKFNLGLQAHIHLHASAQKRYAGKDIKKVVQQRKVSRMAFSGLVNSLESTVKSLDWKPEGTEWAEYYSGTNYTDTAFESKKTLLEDLISIAKPKSIWDLGANTGIFSRVATSQGITTISFDVDPAAVEINYLESKKAKEKHILPLLLDLTNPSPAIGWANEERLSFKQRAPTNLTMALALIHHMAISNNVPLPSLAEFFSRLSRYLIIEFVPKEDSQVQRLLVSREDIFPNYHQEGFEDAFKAYYRVIKALPIPETKRRLYLMERH